MNRNLIEPETRERNRQMFSAWTWNAEVPDDYSGVLVFVAALRLGDHAHLDVHTGRQHPNPRGREPTRHLSRAGRLIFRWHEWETIRDQLTALDVPIILREVEKPTSGQLDHHAFGKQPRHDRDYV